MTTLRLTHSTGSYPVIIEHGAFARLPRHLAKFLPAGRGMIVLTDRNVLRFHGKTLRAALSATGRKAPILVIAPGERSKTLATAMRLYRELLARGMGRNTLLVAVGGGVVGDLGGFVAATYLRGIPFVQIPTTLMAQVDSAIGGKTGVDLPEGKNLVGNFHQPRAVIADPDVLATLPAREFRAGLAEVVKCAVIRNHSFLQWLEASAGRLAQRDRAATTKAIRFAAAVKVAVVMKDEHEKHLRMILNFGHTVGHALETTLGYGRLHHGEAVSIGMVLETRMAERMGWVAAGAAERLAALLAALGLPVAPPPGILRRTVAAMRHDKKATDQGLRFALPKGRLGRCAITAPLPLGQIARLLGAS
ncbi:MAG: 3-dehydroquinate synthase [Planctomycetota bacterium]